MTLGAGVLAGSWVLILTVLVLDLVGVLRRGTGFRWQAAGLLIINSAAVIGGFAHLHRRSEFSALQPVIFPAMLTGFAIFGTGLAIQVRGRRRERHPAR
jgi:uncharacterized membrane protein